MYNIEENFINHQYARAGYRISVRVGDTRVFTNTMREYCSEAKLMPLKGGSNRPVNPKNNIKAYQKKK